MAIETPDINAPTQAPTLTPLAALIFSSRWLQLPLYLGLIVALATAIIGISSIHLLKTFIEAGVAHSQLTNDQIMWQTLIHLVFVVSAIAIAYIDRLMQLAVSK